MMSKSKQARAILSRLSSLLDATKQKGKSMRSLPFFRLSFSRKWSLQTMLTMLIILTSCLASMLIAYTSYQKNKQITTQAVEQQMQLATEVTIEKISMLKSTVTNEDFQKKLSYILTLTKHKFQSLQANPMQFVITKEGKLEKLAGFHSSLPALSPSSIRSIYEKKQGILHIQGLTLSYASSVDLNGDIYVLALNDQDYLQPVFAYQKTSIVISLLIALLASLIGWLIVRKMVKPITLLKHAMEQVGKGNLQTRLQLRHASKDIHALAAGFNQMADSLTALIAHLDTSSKHVSHSSETLKHAAYESRLAFGQISSALGGIASGAEKQAHSTIETTQFFHEIAEGMEQAFHSMEDVEASTNEATHKAHAGNRLVDHAVQQMRLIQKTVGETADAVYILGEKSKRIDQIVHLISQIANQTNLLSLNAAIEAARAGEHGKGFSVVAHEIRNLASQSGEAARQIREIIEEIQHGVNQTVHSMARGSEVIKEGIEIVYQTDTSFKDIAHAVENVSRESKEVAAMIHHVCSQTKQMSMTMEEVSSISQQIAANMEHAAAIVQEQSASVDEVSHASSSLNDLVKQLQQVVQTFKVSARDKN